MSGRWFTGAYDETGIDVKLTRLGCDPVVLGAGAAGAEDRRDRPARCRSSARTCRRRSTPSDIGLGPGVTVTRVVSATPDEIVASKSTSRPTRADRPARRVGRRRRRSRRRWWSTTRSTASRCCRRPAWRASAASVFPEAATSSSRRSRTTTGRTASRTPTTIWTLGLVDVKWSVEEYTAHVRRRRHAVRRRDRPERAVHAERRRPEPEAQPATATTSATCGSSPSYQRPAGTRQPLRARAHLLVTVPLYMEWVTRRWRQ